MLVIVKKDSEIWLQKTNGRNSVSVGFLLGGNQWWLDEWICLQQLEAWYKENRLEEN